MTGPLVDRFGRIHTDLRISVTDRCNIRCVYCMREDGAEFRPHGEILTFEEIRRFVHVASQLGVREVRLTGGEPLVRKDVCRLVEMLAVVPGIDDLSMTTNGILLGQHAGSLRAAGLHRLNVSLDTLDREKFHQLSRRDALDRVLEGIEAAHRAGFRQIKLNALAIRGQTEDEIVPLARFAQKYGMPLRFIEFMPVDGDGRWEEHRVLSGREILDVLTDAFGPLEPTSPPDSPAPATEFRLGDGRLTVGLIGAVSDPFCDRCSRLRLTAEGRIRNCLFSSELWDARAVLRSGGSDAELADLISRAVRAKERQHGSDSGRLASTDRPMHQIGG
ncbi:MAG: GTP 3',8-cyclase MoaA [Planctomycetota bacterium]|jgi:cyclic pyranopterin phosphate synthase